MKWNSLLSRVAHLLSYRTLPFEWNRTSLWQSIRETDDESSNVHTHRTRNLIHKTCIVKKHRWYLSTSASSMVNWLYYTVELATKIKREKKSDVRANNRLFKLKTNSLCFEKKRKEKKTSGIINEECKDVIRRSLPSFVIFNGKTLVNDIIDRIWNATRERLSKGSKKLA